MQHPPKAAPAVQPTVGTTWHEAIGFEICGSFKSPLAQNPNLGKVGIFTTGNGIITISPKNSSEAGNNATLAKFISNYPGLNITSSEIKLPKNPTYVAGKKCPGSNQKSVIKIAEFNSLSGSNYKLDPVNPAKIKLANNHSLTIYYGSQNGTIMAPPSRDILPEISHPPTSLPPSSSLGPSGNPTIKLPTSPPST
jgi:hypothetical protein